MIPAIMGLNSHSRLPALQCLLNAGTLQWGKYPSPGAVRHSPTIAIGGALQGVLPPLGRQCPHTVWGQWALRLPEWYRESGGPLWASLGDYSPQGRERSVAADVCRAVKG